MNAGAYKHKIEIQKNEYSEDSIGNPIDNWVKFKDVYAYVNGLSGSEYWEAAVVHAETTLEIVTRWKPFFNQIDTKSFRVIFQNRPYNIVSIDNIQFRNKTIKMRIQSDV